jgi:hypothetical protein
MRETMTRELFNQIKNTFSEDGMKVKVLEKVEWTNDLIVAEKLPLTTKRSLRLQNEQ